MSHSISHKWYNEFCSFLHPAIFPFNIMSTALNWRMTLKIFPPWNNSNHIQIYWTWGIIYVLKKKPTAEFRNLPYVNICKKKAIVAVWLRFCFSIWLSDGKLSRKSLNMILTFTPSKRFCLPLATEDHKEWAKCKKAYIFWCLMS